MRRPYVWVVLLFFLIFVLDKVFILLWHSSPHAVQHTTVSKRRLVVEKAAYELPHPLTLAYFGSSRSERFVNLAGEIRLAEYLTLEEKAILNNIQYLHLTHIGGLMVTYYRSLQRLEELGLLPELVLVELAPEIFEANHRNFHSRSEMLFSPDYSLYYYFFLLNQTADYEIKKAALLRLLFATFAVRPRLDLLFSPKTVKSDLIDPVTYTRKYTDYLPEQMVGDIKKERVDFFLEMYSTNYRNYEVEPLQEAALLGVIEIVKRHNKQLLLWVPYVMPEFQTVLDKTSFKIFREKIASLAKNKNIPFTVLTGPSKRCRYYSDASHYSTRCTPDVMLRLLHSLGIAKYAKR